VRLCNRILTDRVCCSGPHLGLQTSTDGVDGELEKKEIFGGIVLGESSAINAHHDKRVGQQTVRLLERAHIFISSCSSAHARLASQKLPLSCSSITATSSPRDAFRKACTHFELAILRLFQTLPYRSRSGRRKHGQAATIKRPPTRPRSRQGETRAKHREVQREPERQRFQLEAESSGAVAAMGERRGVSGRAGARMHTESTRVSGRRMSCTPT
jgi:hypothetical protein